MKKVFSFLIPIAICFLSGLIAGWLQAESIVNWYPYLDKPLLTPPNWAFPVAWTIIYLLSGISAGLIWNTAGIYRKKILMLWGVQQFFNFCWSIGFFLLQNPFLGLIIILILDMLVIWYMAKTWHVNRAASLLFLPYLLWIGFATYLNTYILIYN